jgi:mannosyl-oligosaccharide alpha-1,2-mannosidase
MLSNGTLGSISFRLRTLIHSITRHGKPTRASKRSIVVIFVCLVLLLYSPRLLPSPTIENHLTSPPPNPPSSPPLGKPPGKPPSTLSKCPSGYPSIPYKAESPPKFDWRNGLPPPKYPATKGKLPEWTITARAKVQKSPFPSESRSAAGIRLGRREKVRGTFLRGWTSYRRGAWLKDELNPLSGVGKDMDMFGNGWAATLVDNLDTLLIMGLYDEYQEALDAVLQNVHFAPPNASLTISTFETTIRYLGGILSAYDYSGCSEKRLLDKAVELGNMLLRSFDNPKNMPITRWDLQKAVKFSESKDSEIQEVNAQNASTNAILAEFASFGPEMTRLAQLTGDERFFEPVARVQKIMKDQQSQTKIPGLWPIGINAQVPDLTTGKTFGLGSMADSAYEYLIKMYALLGTGAESNDFKQMYETFVDAAVENGMFFQPVAPGSPDILFPGNLMVNQVTISHDEGTQKVSEQKQMPTLDAVGAHLACFVGGMFLLGGQLLQKSDDVQLGIRLAEGCAWAYNASTFGIMPERFHLKVCDAAYKSSNGGTCDVSTAKWEKEFAVRKSDHAPAGFVRIDEKGYALRPEALESVFYAYRVTGDPKYMDMAWSMYESIERTTSTEFGNAAIPDVTTAGKESTLPDKTDSMESFWMAETLKYLYLIFSEPDLISLDDWVLNTEAHPLKRFS